jgi:hypothetical protein
LKQKEEPKASAPLNPKVRKKEEAITKTNAQEKIRENRGKWVKGNVKMKKRRQLLRR